MYVSHRSICHGWTRLIPPPSSFGVSTGETLTAAPPRFKVPSAFPGLLAASFAAAAHLRWATRLAHRMAGIGGMSPCQGTLLWLWEMQESNLQLPFSPCYNLIRGRGSLAPRYCPLPGTVVVVWFDFGEGYLHIASTKVPIAVTCLRMRAFALASFWHSSL